MKKISLPLNEPLHAGQLLAFREPPAILSLVRVVSTKATPTDVSIEFEVVASWDVVPAAMLDLGSRYKLSVRRAYTVCSFFNLDATTVDDGLREIERCYAGRALSWAVGAAKDGVSS